MVIRSSTQYILYIYISESIADFKIFQTMVVPPGIFVRTRLLKLGQIIRLDKKLMRDERIIKLQSIKLKFLRYACHICCALFIVACCCIWLYVVAYC